jgi:L-malate glycosyltransferase
LKGASAVPTTADRPVRADGSNAFRSDAPARPKIKVCHLVSGALWAGAEVMAYCLLKGLKAFPDLELSAIALNHGRFAENVRRLGIPVAVVDETRLRFPRILGRVMEILKGEDPDIVHSHWYKENILAFLASGMGKRSSLVSTQHGMPEYGGRRGDAKYIALHRCNFFILSRYFHGTVAVSGEIRRLLVERFGFDKSRTLVIHNGTDLPDRPAQDRSRECFTIGSSGRLFPVKDYPLMVEIAREVAKRTDGIRFELAGTGPDGEGIGDLVHRSGLEKTFFLRGFVNEVSTFYRGLDLYLNTSRHEGIPMSVLEAMAHGLPVVAPDVGGLREVLNDGVQGFLVKGRDPRVFADKCLLLYRDGTLRQRMASAARERIDAAFSNRRMARDYQRLYHSLRETGRVDADGEFERAMS